MCYECECGYDDDEPFHEYVPTLKDWALYRLRPLGKFKRRVKRWWKYSVRKEPRPQSSLILGEFDAFLKEIYPARTAEFIASSTHPILDYRVKPTAVVYGEPRPTTTVASARLTEDE